VRAVLFAARGRSYTSPLFAARAGSQEFDDLSPRQLTALRLLARGLERRGDRRADGARRGDLKTHLSEVRRKLGARTSAQAVAVGLVNSLFDYPSPESGSVEPSAG